MSDETTTTPRWYHVRLRDGVREDSPFRYARKSSGGYVILTNGAYATGVLTTAEAAARYVTTGVVAADRQKAIEDRYQWELHR